MKMTEPWMRISVISSRMPWDTSSLDAGVIRHCSTLEDWRRLREAMGSFGSGGLRRLVTRSGGRCRSKCRLDLYQVTKERVVVKERYLLAFVYDGILQLD